MLSIINNPASVAGRINLYNAQNIREKYMLLLINLIKMELLKISLRKAARESLSQSRQRNLSHSLKPYPMLDMKIKLLF